MSEGQIQIDVEFNGAQEAVASLGRVEQGVREVGTASAASGTSLQGMATQFSSTAQRVQGVAGAIQGLVGALGSRDRTAGLVASVAGATAQFAAMGSMLGPAGTLAGGVIGLTTSILSLARANDDVAASARAARNELAALANQRIAERNEEAMRRRISRGDLAGVSGTDLEREREMRSIELERLDEQFRALMERHREAVAMYEGAGRSVPADIRRSMSEELRNLREAHGELRGEWENINSELVGRGGGLGTPTPTTTTTRTGGGGGGPSPAEEAWDRYNAAMEDAETRRAAAEEAAREAAAEHNAAILEEETKRYEAERALADEAAEEERKRMEESLELHRQLAEKQADIDQEMAAKRQQVAEQAMEQRRQTSQEMTGMLGDMTMSFGKSLAAIATGEKTADEAFKGLLKSFLEMISQYATLKAATEFADAGSAFARYDYAGGAGHIAAGVAFTAVAVATGVGAGALGAAPSAPARPESSGVGESGGKGGDVIINWNSPVVTAGTKAELGREIGVMLGEAAAL